MYRVHIVDPSNVRCFVNGIVLRPDLLSHFSAQSRWTFVHGMSNALVCRKRRSHSAAFASYPVGSSLDFFYINDTTPFLLRLCFHSAHRPQGVPAITFDCFSQRSGLVDSDFVSECVKSCYSDYIIDKVGTCRAIRIHLYMCACVCVGIKGVVSTSHRCNNKDHVNTSCSYPHTAPPCWTLSCWPLNNCCTSKQLRDTSFLYTFCPSRLSTLLQR